MISGDRTNSTTTIHIGLYRWVGYNMMTHERGGREGRGVGSMPALLPLPFSIYSSVYSYHCLSQFTANACLFGISNKNLSRIQRIQNTLARVVTFSRSRSSTAPLLKHLHWLPVSARIHFKIALLTFKSLHAIAPSYLSSLVRPYVPSRALRSSSAHQLCVPHVSTVFGSRGFRLAGPAIWNSLPLSVTSCSTIHTFKKQLKTHLFASAFPSSWIVLDAPLIRWSPFMYLFGCPWFCACLNVCYYYYYLLLVLLSYSYLAHLCMLSSASHVPYLFLSLWHEFIFQPRNGLSNRDVSTGISNRDLSTGISIRDISTEISNRDISTGISNRDISTGISNRDISIHSCVVYKVFCCISAGRAEFRESEASVRGHRDRDARTRHGGIQRLHLRVRTNWGGQKLHDDGKKWDRPTGYHTTGMWVSYHRYVGLWVSYQRYVGIISQVYVSIIPQVCGYHITGMWVSYHRYVGIIPQVCGYHTTDNVQSRLHGQGGLGYRK